MGHSRAGWKPGRSDEHACLHSPSMGEVCAAAGGRAEVRGAEGQSLPGLFSLRLTAGELAHALAEVLGSAVLLHALPHLLAPRRLPWGPGGRHSAVPRSGGPGRTWSSLRCEECDRITRSLGGKGLD